MDFGIGLRKVDFEDTVGGITYKIQTQYLFLNPISQPQTKKATDRFGQWLFFISKFSYSLNFSILEFFNLPIPNSQS